MYGSKSLLLLLFFSINVFAQTQSVGQSGKLMGQEISITHQSGVTTANGADASGVNTTSTTKFLGHSQTLMEANLALPTGVINPGDVANAVVNDLYIAGKRVWNGSFTEQGNTLIYKGGIAPTQIPFPLVVYPVGPVILEVDAGVNFAVSVVGKITPSVDASDVIGNVDLYAAAMGAAYLEGYASLLIIRAGVGGQITVIDGNADVSANFFKSKSPELKYLGRLTLLSGRVYAFLDLKLFFGKWSRLWNHNFYSYPGKCVAFGGLVCGIN